MTYQRQMTDEFLDKELAEVKKGLTSLRQSRVKHENQIESIVKEAVNQKYHSPSKKACQVFMKFKAAGFSDVAADSMCRQAHKYNINPNLDLSQILNVVKAKTAQLTNNKPSIEPGNTGVSDRPYPESSYGSDVPSCIASLTSIGVDPQRASVECETQYAGKGYRGGMSWTTPPIKGPSGFTVKKSAGSRSVRVHNASVQDEVPYWAKISCSDEVAATPRNRGIHNSIRSASDISAAKKYHDAISEDISTTVKNRGEAKLNAIEENRIKSGKYEGKSSWAIACNL